MLIMSCDRANYSSNLIQAILSDLFPGREIPDHDYGKLQSTIEDCLLEQKLQVKYRCVNLSVNQ